MPHNRHDAQRFFRQAQVDLYCLADKQTVLNQSAEAIFAEIKADAVRNSNPRIGQAMKRERNAELHTPVALRFLHESRLSLHGSLVTDPPETPRI